MNTDRSRVSLVLTVLNERANIQGVLDTIAAQTRLPHEVVVCDGGSRDGTPDVIRAERRFPVTVLVEPGSNISQGRNRAIAAAAGPIIACTDAGVRLEPDWLERITRPFEAPQPPSVVAGFFVADPRTTFELAMGATVLPARDDVRPATFLPSSRSVAFLKSAWRAVGGYPEWLDYCEDLIFDMALRDRFGPFAIALDAVAHFRPRGSLKSFFKQYYLYARGDGKAGLFFKRHMIRYGTYVVALPILLGAIAAAPQLWMKAVALAGLACGVAAYTRGPYRRLRAGWSGLGPAERLKAALWVPAIRVTGDLGKMCGYPVGLVWRAFRRPRPAP